MEKIILLFSKRVYEKALQKQVQQAW